jgi:hypothetical protein
MKNKIVDGPKLGRILKRNAGSEGISINLAISYIGKSALDLLGGGDLRNTYLVCDYLSGGTNPDAVDELIKAGAKVRHLEGLHAKTGIVGDNLSFVGSSNLSINGLVNDARYECAVVFDGVKKKIASEWKEMWERSLEISPEMKAMAKDAWRIRKKAKQDIRGSVYQGRTFVEVLLDDPSYFELRNTYFTIYPTLTKDEEPIINAANEEAAQRYGAAYEVYWDWADLPDQALLVDFRVGHRNGIHFEGVYERNPKFEDFKQASEDFQTCLKLRENKIGQVRISKGDKDKLKVAVKQFVKANGSGESHCIKAHELVEFLDAV